MLIVTVFVTSSIVTFCFLPTHLSTFFFFASTEEFVNGDLIGLAAFLGRQSISQSTWLLWLAGRRFRPWPD